MWHCNRHGAGALHSGWVRLCHQSLLLRFHTECSEVHLPQEVCTHSPHLIQASAFQISALKKMQSLRFSSLFHRFFLICLLSQEKIPISLTPFLTRKIHNVSLCSFFFVRLLSLISTTDKARRQCHSIYTAFPVHHILIIVCQLLRTVFSLKDSHRNVIDSLTGNSAWTNRDNLMSNRSSTVYNQKHPCGLSLHAINIEKNSRGIYFPLFI